MEFQLKQEDRAGRQGLRQLIKHYAAHLDLPRPEDPYQALRDAVRLLRDAVTGSDDQAPGDGLPPLKSAPY